MSIRVQSVPGEYYHIYNRGVEKRVVFDNQHDYQRFLLLLLLANDTTSVDINQSIRDFSIPELIKRSRKPLVSVYAYSLLPNHFHLLMSSNVERGIGKFKQKVSTGYTMYFNIKNERTGSLFQGKYKIKHAAKNEYLKYLFEYIHLNPVRKKFDMIDSSRVESLINEVESDPGTSLSVYSGNESGRISDSVLDKTLFKELFPSYKKHYQSLCRWKGLSFEEGPTFLK